MGSFVDNTAVYYFDLLDPDKTGRVLAADAATFLRTSGKKYSVPQVAMLSHRVLGCYVTSQVAMLLHRLLFNSSF